MHRHQLSTGTCSAQPQSNPLPVFLHHVPDAYTRTPAPATIPSVSRYPSASELDQTSSCPIRVASDATKPDSCTSTSGTQDCGSQNGQNAPPNGVSCEGTNQLG